MKTTLNEFARQAFSNAVVKGFHEKDQPISEAVALMHSELSELLEDARAGNAPTVTWYERPDGSIADIPAGCAYPNGGGLHVLYKPCGIPSELADLLIRAFDFAGKHGIDLDAAVQQKMAYNATRPRMHGGKKF